MGSKVRTSEAAINIAESYAKEECVGTLGKIVNVVREDGSWIVELRTHTFSEEYTHRIEITEAVGNIIGHDRTKLSA
jgi:hypothetical protein